MKKIIVLLLLYGPYSTLSAQLSKDKIKKIDALIQSYAAVKQFTGNALVIQRGRQVFSKSYGFSDFEWKIPNDRQTKFRIGSITKQFTGMI